MMMQAAQTLNPHPCIRSGEDLPSGSSRDQPSSVLYHLVQLSLGSRKPFLFQGQLERNHGTLSAGNT